MPKSIQQRVLAAQAAQAKTREAAEYKAGEAERRSKAAKLAAAIRKDERIDAVLTGREDPRTLAEFRMLDRLEFGGES